MMQDFSLQVQDGVRSPFFFFVFFFTVSSYVSLHIIVDRLFRGLVEQPGHDEPTRDPSRTGRRRHRRRKRPISARTTARKPTTMQIAASVSVWAIVCPFFAMKKAIRPPGRRRSLSLVFLAVITPTKRFSIDNSGLSSKKP